MRLPLRVCLMSSCLLSSSSSGAGTSRLAAYLQVSVSHAHISAPRLSRPLDPGARGASGLEECAGRL